MSRTIHPGQTLTLFQDTTLTGLATIQGATVAYGQGGHGVVARGTTLTNVGTIEIGHGAAAGFAAGGRGGVLDVKGVLLNEGTIALQGGVPSTGSEKNGYGGILENNGVLTNAGVLIAGGDYSRFTNYDTLTNTGTILIMGGSGHYGPSGALQSSGVLTNDGIIIAEGSALYGPIGGSIGTGRGDFINNGTIIAQGGTGVGGAGELGISYSLTNSATGVIQLSAGNTANSAAAILFSDRGTISNAGLIQGVVTTATDQAGIFSEGVIADTGTILLSTGPSPEFGTQGDFTLFDSIYGDGMLRMSGSAYVSAYIALGIGTTITGSGTIVGTIAGPSYLNNGFPPVELTANGGTLTIDAPVGRYINIGAEAASRLVLNGAVNNTDTVTLFAASSVLQTGAANSDLRIVSATGGTLTITGGGGAALNAVDSDLAAVLASPGSLTLSQQAFVTGIGSTGADSITALTAGQTLTGGLGADTLIGAASDGDTFMDTAAGLNGDTIGNFAGSDEIDLTDLAPGATLAYTQNGSSGTLKVTEGAQSTSITLLGTFALSDFTTGSDGHGGLLIGLH